MAASVYSEEFSEQLRRFGGTFFPEPPAPENIILFNARLREQAQHNIRVAQDHLYLKPRRIDFAFLGMGDLNGVAFASPASDASQFDFIGITAGTPMTLLNVFFNMLARPDIFPDVGDVSLENKNLPPIDCLTTDVMAANTSFAEPQCAVRRVFARQMIDIAFDFIFFHELGHLKNGHIELLRELTQNTALVELDGTKAGNEQVRRALETHADFGGIEGALNVAHGKFDRLAEYKDQVPDEYYRGRVALLGSPLRATLHTVFAAYVVFRLFHENFIARGGTHAEPYPPPATRFCSVMKAAMKHHEWLGRNETYPPGQFEYYLFRTAINAEIACSEIWGGNVDAAILMGAAKEALPAFEIEYSQTWAEIEPILNKFKRGATLNEFRL